MIAEPFVRWVLIALGGLLLLAAIRSFLNQFK
jgi:hypothetical protein